MRGVLAIAIVVASAVGPAGAQSVWDPPLDKPPRIRDARAFDVRGGAVPVFRDGGAATDAWFMAARHGRPLDEDMRATVQCSVPNNGPLTVSRVFSDDGTPMFAVVMANGIAGCRGVMFWRDLRITQGR